MACLAATPVGEEGVVVVMRGLEWVLGLEVML